MREDFTNYDIKPEEFLNYLRYYGEHFNKKLCEFACENMKHHMSKEEVMLLLQLNGIQLLNTKMHDVVYIANWAKSKFFGSSIPDEKKLALFIKDVYEKEGDLVFNRWYADCAKLGIPVEWEDMI